MSEKTGEEAYLRKKIQLFDNALEHLASAHQKWKYIENFYTGEVELYDLVNDPGELQSLHANPLQALRIWLMRLRLNEQWPGWDWTL